MRKFNLATCLLVLTVLTSLGQNYKSTGYMPQNRCSYVTPQQTNTWLFYKNQGIVFSDGAGGVQVAALNNPSMDGLPAGNSCSVLSDSLGYLLIYTNGQKVYNKNFQNFTVTNLEGNAALPQSSLIVQNPDPAYKQMVYVFTTDLDLGATNPSNGFCFTRADLSGNGGVGIIFDPDLNKTLLANGAQMVAGVRNGDGVNYWVMAHEDNSDKFHAYAVTGEGVSSSSVSSSIGRTLSISNFGSWGMMKFSPKGDKLAMASYGGKFIQVFGFDNKTGRVTSEIAEYDLSATIAAKQGPYSIEFSPDGSKLYFVIANQSESAGIGNKLFQADLLAPSASPVLLNSTNFPDGIFSLQLGRDGKVYVLKRNDDLLVIQNPNWPGLNCNLNYSGLFPLGTPTYNGLPNFVSSFLNVPPANYETNCENDATLFTMLNTANLTDADVKWDFGDPDSPDNTATGISPVHTFSKPGTFTVTWEEYSGGALMTTNSIEVVIHPLPIKSFEALYPTKQAFLVEGNTLPLYGQPGMYSYQWFDENDTNLGSSVMYIVDRKGAYTLVVEDMNCCVNRDTLKVDEIVVRVPTAVVPNSGIPVNQIFKGIDEFNGIGIVDFTLVIFDRWGQQVWTTNSFDDKWDCTVGSNIAPAGIYQWYMSFNVKENVMNQGKVNLKGSFMILR